MDSSMLITGFERGTAVREIPQDPAAAMAWTKQGEHRWIWLSLESADASTWQDLGHALGLEHLAMEDMQEQHQRTKFESYGEHSFLVLRPVKYNDQQERIHVGEIHLYVGHAFLLSHRLPQENCGKAAFKRVCSSPKLASLGPRGGAYAVIDEVVDAYEPALDGLNEDIDQVDEVLYNGSTQDVATRVYGLSRQVGAFLRAVTPLAGALAAARKVVAGDDLELMVGATGPHSELREAWASQDTTVGGAAQQDRLLSGLLRDVEDHAQRTVGHLAEMRTTLSNALSLATALTSERASNVGLKQTEQSKKVSSWAAIFAAPTVIAGVWGMNFKYMPELDLTWGYPAALCIMVGVSTALYAVFKKKGWL